MIIRSIDDLEKYTPEEVEDIRSTISLSLTTLEDHLSPEKERLLLWTNIKSGQNPWGRNVLSVRVRGCSRRKFVL